MIKYQYLESPWGKIYYCHRQVSSESIIMLTGLGSTCRSLQGILYQLSNEYSVASMDNLGAGFSPQPSEEFSIEEMAESLEYILKNLGINNFHLSGISMGGLVAQAYAAKYPEKIKSLGLFATHVGGLKYQKPSQEVQDIWAEENTEDTLAVKKRISTCYSQKTLEKQPGLVDLLMEFWQSEVPKQRPDSFKKQRQAADLFGKAVDGWYDGPTLIISGSQDVVVVPENHQLLLKRYINARSFTIDGGHFFMFESKREFLEIYKNFLKEVRNGE